MHEREEFLSAVASRLPFPDDVRNEVLEELSGHIDDASAALTAEGMPPARAETEAISRLGSPDALAKEIATAHQTPARLLAALGPGVWSASVNGFLGMLAGTAAAALLTIAAALALSLAHRVVNWAPPLPVDQAWNTAIVALGMSLGAFAAGRAGTLEIARRSRRSPEQIGRWMAGVGGVLLLLLVLFAIRMPQSWVRTYALLLVPLAFASGALRATRRSPRLLDRRLLLLVPVVLVLAVALLFPAAVVMEGGGAGGGRAVTWSSEEEMHRSLGYDLIGRPLQDATPVETSGSAGERDGVQRLETTVEPATLLRGFRDLRFEAWRALQNGPPAIDRGYRAPFAIAPARVDDGRVEGALVVNRTPDVHHYLVALTGVRADGQRYLIDLPGGGYTSFTGTVWEWLTFPREERTRPRPPPG